jgi:preprotein translocase subunit SecB
MSKAKQPAKRTKVDSSPAQTPADYSQLLELINLARIWLVKMDFALETQCNSPQRYQMQIGRTPGELEIHDSYLCITLGYEIKGKADETNIFTGHYHFVIIFDLNDHDLVHKLLEDEQIKATFLGAQAEKLVWSYLRKGIQQALLDAGLPAAVLPLYR